MGREKRRGQIGLNLKVSTKTEGNVDKANSFGQTDPRTRANSKTTTSAKKSTSNKGTPTMKSDSKI